MEVVVGAGAVLLGVILGLFAEGHRERKRRSSEYGKRMTGAVSDFLAASIACDDLSWDLWHERHDPENYTRPPASDAVEGRLGVALRELMPPYYEALLIVPDGLERPVDAVYEHIKEYSKRIEDSTVDPEEWQERWRALRVDLVEATRNQFDPPWWERWISTAKYRAVGGAAD